LNIVSASPTGESPDDPCLQEDEEDIGCLGVDQIRSHGLVVISMASRIWLTIDVSLIEETAFMPDKASNPTYG
jgi:hypothetical protein